MKSLVIGKGEIGIALHKIIGGEIRDTEEVEFEQDFDILHICFPYSGLFDAEVKKYQNEYRPKHIVIHSTVPVGTCRKLGAIHSPVRGKHPFLEESLKTFVKFVGGENIDEVADYFRRFGMKVQICRSQETTELMKLLDTAYYGLCIEFVKEVERACKEYNVPFSEVYTLANQTYNEGYVKLGNPEYARPILQPLQKRIGGHCVLANIKLLKSWTSDFLDRMNR